MLFVSFLNKDSLTLVDLSCPNVDEFLLNKVRLWARRSESIPPRT